MASKLDSARQDCHADKASSPSNKHAFSNSSCCRVGRKAAVLSLKRAANSSPQSAPSVEDALDDLGILGTVSATHTTRIGIVQSPLAEQLR